MAWEAHSTPEHYCDAWQANPKIIPENLTLPSDDRFYFYLKISAVFEAYAMEDEEEDDDHEEPSMYDIVEESVEHEKCFLVPYDHLLQDQTSWSTLSDMLSQVHVPIDEQPTMLHRISRSARVIARDPGNLGSKILPMMIRISVSSVAELDEGAEEEDDTTSANAGSRKESVEALESLEIERSKGFCVICQDEIVVGCTAKRMPCRHVYHGDCVVNWLRVKKFCPLCRFELT